MTTISHIFEQFAQALELSEPEERNASQQQNSLRENLRRTLGGFVTDRLIGSYARRTAIRPLHDIDLLVVLDPAVHSDVSMASPNACLRKVQRALAASYPNKVTPDLQRRSVGISFSGSGIDYDVVPAFEVPGMQNVYRIPDRVGNVWIHTNPALHAERSTQANARAANKLKPVFKMLKYWRRTAGCGLASFHMEALSWDVFPGDPGRYPDALCLLTEALSIRVRGSCPDPARVGPAVDADLTVSSRDREVRRLSEAAQHMRRILTMERQGDVPRAIAEWRALLGNVFVGK